MLFILYDLFLFFGFGIAMLLIGFYVGNFYREYRNDVLNRPDTQESIRKDIRKIETYLEKGRTSK